MINVAVIGTGGLGSRHAINFAQIAGCRVKRVYDLVTENAENCAEPLGAEVASDFDQSGQAYLLREADDSYSG